MKVADLNIEDWQTWLDKFKAAHPNAKPGAAMRIENTQFAPARYYGGMIYNGEKYTYFEPVDERQPRNPDGTTYVAWLMVRMDFLRWVTAELKKKEASWSKRKSRPKKQPEQRKEAFALGFEGGVVEHLGEVR